MLNELLAERHTPLVRASMVYLLAGFTLGALALARDRISYDPAIMTLLPIHMEFLRVGWLVQLAMSVAFWIFPRFGLGLPRSRGNEKLIWVSFMLLNAGIWIVALELWISVAFLILQRKVRALRVLLMAFLPFSPSSPTLPPNGEGSLLSLWERERVRENWQGTIARPCAVILIGRVLEVGAVIIYAAGLWRRVKPHGA